MFEGLRIGFVLFGILLIMAGLVLFVSSTSSQTGVGALIGVLAQFFWVAILGVMLFLIFKLYSFVLQQIKDGRQRHTRNTFSLTKNEGQ